jgi:hypothetical protein
MKIRTLSLGATGPEVKWLKSWLNVLVSPPPQLKPDGKFDGDTANAVRHFKMRSGIVPANGVADAHVYAAIWQASAPTLANTTSFGSSLRFDRTVFLNHFLRSFTTVEPQTVPNLMKFLGKVEWDPKFLVEHVPWVAYMLATTWWETGRTFAPVAESGCNDKTGCKPVVIRGKVNNRTYGKPRPCPNLTASPPSPCPADPTNKHKTHTYFGRGYVQLTHFSHYVRTSKELYRRGLVPAEDHLVHFPEAARDEDLAYQIISVGLREGEFFTQQPIGRVIDVSHPVTPAKRLVQYKKARALVNGTDFMDQIANLAVKFEALLTVSRIDAPHWSTLQPARPGAGLKLPPVGSTTPGPELPSVPTPSGFGPF